MNERLTTLKSNVQKIENYLRTEIVPRLNGQITRAKTDFGRLKRYPGSWKPELEHTLSVNRDGSIYYRSGGLVLKIGEKDYVHDSLYDSITYAEDLILYWQEAKQGLLGDLAAQEQEFKVLENFEV